MSEEKIELAMGENGPVVIDEGNAGRSLSIRFSQDDDPEGLSLPYELGRTISESSSFAGSGSIVMHEGDLNPYAIRTPDDDDASICPQDPGHHFPIPDEHGKPARYPGEDDSKKLDEDPSMHSLRSIMVAAIESLKYLYSCVLLVFSVAVVMAAIFTEQTVGTGEKNIHPAAAFVIFWFLIVWLAMMEGGQGCLVGLQPIEKEQYADTHPRAFLNTKLSHKGDNMERFIVGRQFLAVLVVFVTNLMSSAIEGASVFGFSDIMSEIFLASGVAVILTTIMLGQLTAQVNAANCMLDFINNYFMLFTTYVSLAIEYSGLLHSVYLVQIFLSAVTGKPIESSEPPRNASQKLFFWARVIVSLAILGFAFAVTMTALFAGNTTMWDGIPPYVSVIIFFILMCFVGMMEGMQIALFAVVNMSEEELKQHSIAYSNCQLIFTGQNLQAFLIGRQICVTICTFVVARITTLDYGDDDKNVFGVNDSIQDFFNTGLLGAVITTIVASLAWRVIASSFPLAFLSNPLINIVIRLCLLLEASGLCSASWVLARYHKMIVGYQPDEVYLEGAEKHTSEPVTRRDKDIDRVVTVVKFAYSLALLVFSIAVLMAAMFSEQTVETDENNIHPVTAAVVFWLMIIWLAMMEGGQRCLVGLVPVNPKEYAGSHPRALLNTHLAHKGDNLERFIVGRQFLVVVVVFVTNLMSLAVADASVLGLPDVLNEVFLASGIALILITIMLGQLTAQVNAANCMLDFVNNYFMLFTTYISLVIESSGVLHSVYLVRMLFSMITGKPIHNKGPPRNILQNIFFWARVVMSLGILGFAFAVTVTAMFDGKTTVWEGVPPYLSAIIFLVLVCFVGMMEGLQIALFSILNMTEEDLKQHSIAYANYQLTFAGQNLQAFLIGRQICVTICMFVLARVTTSDYSGEETNVFGVDDSIQNFFDTGLLGAVITTIVASLAWRVVASSFPLAFLSNPLINIIIRLCLLLEASGICGAAWMLGRFNKILVGYQPDDVYLEDAEPHGKKPVTKRDKDIDITVRVIKYLYSTALLVFSVLIVMAAIFTEQTNVSESIHPVLGFFIFWGSIVWLAMMEGGQGCLVGLQPVDKELYKESHKVSYRCTSLSQRGNNMGRFIVGRQFLVVLVVFVTNLMSTAVADASVLGLPDVFNEVFLATGVAVILTTIMLGQLTAQVNAASCMLDFINTYIMLFTTYISLAIEFSGLLHCVYLVQILFSKIAGKPIGSKEPPRNAAQNFFFWARVLMSVLILVLAFAVTLSALFRGKTTMWEGIPSYVSVMIFFILMCFVGMMEGMQIALFAVVNMSEEELKQHSIAYANCQLTFAGQNLQAFLIGRQICVTICMFVIARITTLDIGSGDGNIFGVNDSIQDFFNTGLLGAIITTIVASLAWRIVASAFPLAFLSNPLIYLIIRLCLFLEASGVCSAAWLMASIYKQIVGSQPDKVYIGTAEERAAAAKDVEHEESDDEEALVDEV